MLVTLKPLLPIMDFVQEGGSYRPWFFNATAVSEKLLAEKPLLYGPSLVSIC